MVDLDQALADISSIRRQMAYSTEFRGYGPATLAGTGLLAVAAATAQAVWFAGAAHHISWYLSIWIGTAVVSAAVIGAQMHTRSRRVHSGMSAEMIRMAVEQFLPAMIAGALTTAVLVGFVPALGWMLPGVWQVIFSFGVFSSCRFLPRATLSVGAWYLLTGLGCLAIGDDRALSPWAMGIPFCVGQLLVALILFRSSRQAAHEK
jgi:hypothetical protein